MLQVLVISLLIAVSTADGMQVSRRAFANWKALRGFARNSVQNAPPAECRKAIDLGIVMDRSLRSPGSGTGWGDVMQFVKKLVGKFHISDDMTHIGAISFDQTAEVLLKFNDLFGDGYSLEAVLRQMNTWRPGPQAEKNEGKVIDQALQLARTNLFTDRDGARGYDHVLVLLTDGWQAKPGMENGTPENIARELEQEGVKIIVVGIGTPDPVELWKIAGAMTDPTKGNNVFNMMDPNMVDSVADQVAQTTCMM